MEKLFTVQELSELLRIKPSTIYKWVHYGYIPHLKLGSSTRFKGQTVEKWLKKREKRGRNSLSFKIDSFYE